MHRSIARVSASARGSGAPFGALAECVNALCGQTRSPKNRDGELSSPACVRSLPPRQFSTCCQKQQAGSLCSMIISHKYKLIFIKTVKTAGTSIEVFLSKQCGPMDIVTPIAPPVEGHQSRNYEGFINP